MTTAKRLMGILCMSIWASSGAVAVEFIAHRGASHDAPENTVGAMRLGFAQGADAGELDVHLSADGRIVVIHDFDTARVAGVSNVVAQTGAEALTRLEAGQWGKWRGTPYRENIPLLETALETVPEAKRVFIEIKCGPEILPELERVLAASRLRAEQKVIIGFGWETMRQAKERFPGLRVFWLAGADKNKRYAPVGELIEKARAAKVDGLNLEKGFPIDRAFVEQVRAAGLQLYVWTVDEPEVAARLVAAGVDGITTNRPQWLRHAVQAE
jgi:glycerophosphoryl diester phosphodiesterase